jgi:hypothetical protein
MFLRTGAWMTPQTDGSRELLASTPILERASEGGERVLSGTRFDQRLADLAAKRLDRPITADIDTCMDIREQPLRSRQLKARGDQLLRLEAADLGVDGFTGRRACQFARLALECVERLMEVGEALTRNA